MLCKTSPHCVFPGCLSRVSFSRLFWGYGIWGGEHRSQVLFPSHLSGDVLSTWCITVDADLEHVAEITCVRFLLTKNNKNRNKTALPLTSLHPHGHLQKGVTCSPYLCGESSPSMWNICSQYLELFCTGHLSLFPHSFIYSIIYVDVNLWIFLFFFHFGL